MPPQTLAPRTQRTQTDRVTLYFRQGSSDKVYQASVDPSGDGYVVNFAYGRRGSTFTTGIKTPVPVDYPTAKKTFDKLVREKTAKGYTRGEDGAPYQHTDRQRSNTGVLPQLLNAIDESEVEPYLIDDRYWMQQKFDGRRLLIRKDGGEIMGINRNGLTVAVPKPIADAVRTAVADACLLDGEAVGDVYHVFDILERDEMNFMASPYAVRYAELLNLVDAVESDRLRYAHAAIHTPAKREMLDRLRREKQEGVVFKDRHAPYTPGRPASGGTQRKLKFWASVSCIVSAVNGTRRSVSLKLFNGEDIVFVGNVTVPSNQPIPAVGEIIEVRYLYAHHGGSLYQPVLLGVRDDIDAESCTVSQLKFKPASTDDGEDA